MGHIACRVGARDSDQTRDWDLEIGGNMEAVVGLLLVTLIFPQLVATKGSNLRLRPWAKWLLPPHNIL